MQSTLRHENNRGIGLWSNLPMIGTAAGLIGGLAYRTYMHIPTDFKILNRLDAIPFQLPVLNTVNGAMQTMLKGPMKYMIPALPLLSIGAGVTKRAWQGRNKELRVIESSGALISHVKPGFWLRFKNEVKHIPTTKLVQATTLVALALIMSVTQTHWLPAVTQLLPLGADPSGHALMQIALSWSQSLCTSVDAKSGYSKNTHRFFNAMSAGLGAANAIFMFNTSTTFHTVREIASGSMLALGAIGVSSYVSQGLPGILDLTQVTSGATMIAAAMGYDTTTFTTFVLTPLAAAYMAKVPFEAHKHSKGNIIIGLTVATALIFTNPALTMIGIPAGFTGLLKAGRMVTAAGTGLLIVVIAVHEMINRPTTRHRYIAVGLTVGQMIAISGALFSGSGAIGGSLWIASVGCGFFKNHYMNERRPVR